MATFWMVAADLKRTSKDAHFQGLCSSVGRISETSPTNFAVPSSIKFGSFDDLIRLTDELQKHDTQVEGCVKRIERMYADIDEAVFNNPIQNVKVSRGQDITSFGDYLQGWAWDEGKYPKERGLQAIVTQLIFAVSKIDEDARNKFAQFNEVKTAKTNMEKKETSSILNRDLIDVLTPSTVEARDFCYTEHLTTLIMILPQAGVEQFLATYETYAENVVPLSAKQFNIVEDNTTFWRIILFKSSVEAFLKTAREERLGTCRQFEFSENAFHMLKKQRQELVTESTKQEKIMTGFCKAAFSDVLVAWMHVKCMRVFVESVLRFGIPASEGNSSFAAFIVHIKAGKEAQARKAIQNAIAAGCGAGYSTGGGEGDGEEDYFPYVSVSLTPFTVK